MEADAFARLSAHGTGWKDYLLVWLPRDGRLADVGFGDSKELLEVAGTLSLSSFKLLSYTPIDRTDACPSFDRGLGRCVFKARLELRQLSGLVPK